MLLYTMKSRRPLYNVPLRLAKNKQYGIYGGSFNPVHEGHKAVSNYAFQVLNLQKVIWFVTPKNPFKASSLYASYEKRFDDVKKLISNPHFIISHTEKIMQSHNSYEIISILEKRFGHYGIKFINIIGSDNLRMLHKWHFFKKIAKIVRFAIIVRPQHQFSIQGLPAIRYLKANNIGYDIILKPFKHISSTQLREK